MDIIAKARFVRESPQKIRVVTNLVKPLPLKEALIKLEFSYKKAAESLLKVLKSAIANAEHNFDLEENQLKIKEIQVGPAPVLKRLKPRARGRGDVVRKRSSHIRVVLEKKSEIRISKSETNSNNQNPNDQN